MGLAEDLDAFARRPNLSPATRAFYRDPLFQTFLPWATKQGITETAELTPAHMEHFAIHLEKKKSKRGGLLAVASRRAYLKAVQQFFSWLSSSDRAPMPAKMVPIPPLRKTPRPVLTRAELQTLEDAAAIPRDKVIVRLMADTGAREGEIANIRKGDLIERDRVYHFVRLRGKTGERLAPIDAKLYRRLIEYSGDRQGRPRTRSEFLFMAHRKRNQGTYEPLTEAGIYGLIKDAAERADIGKRIYPHLLRHSAITHMVASGMNIVTVAEIVGVSVTVISTHYAHQTDEQRWDAMMKVFGA
jgi:integrase